MDPSTDGVPTAGTRRPLIKTYIVAEVQCYLCGSSAGSLECERQAGPGAPLFRPAGRQQALRLANWRSLRCPRCGGRVHLEEIQTVRRRVEPEPGDPWMDRPRRGRPPKRPPGSAGPEEPRVA